MNNSSHHRATAAGNSFLATICVFGSLAMYAYGITDTAILYMLVAIYLRMIAKESIDAHNTESIAGTIAGIAAEYAKATHRQQGVESHFQRDSGVRDDS